VPLSVHLPLPCSLCPARRGIGGSKTGPELELSSRAAALNKTSTHIAQLAHDRYFLIDRSHPYSSLPIIAAIPTMAAAAVVDRAPRERKLSMGAPISTLVGPVGPGFSRPKHKRTATGFGAADIKSVEASIPEHQREA
jgi:hypothetical protein